MQESDRATSNLTASDLEEMARLCVTFYDHACEWKDQARRSPEYEPLFLAACEGNMRAMTYAEILSCHLENRILRQNYCALRYYYHYEAMSCQIPFLKKAKVEEEIQCLKDMSAVLEKGIEALGNCEDKKFVKANLEAWRLLLLSNRAELSAASSDKLRDEGKFVDASDSYQNAAKKFRAALEYCRKASESEAASIEIQMERLLQSNLIASECNAFLMKFYFHREEGNVVEATESLLTAIEKSDSLCAINPEWPPHFTKRAQIEDIGVEFLRNHKDHWKDLIRRFSSHVLRRLIEKIDPNDYEILKDTNGGNTYIMGNTTVQNFHGPVGIGSMDGNSHVDHIEVHGNNTLEERIQSMDLLMKFVKENCSEEACKEFTLMAQEWEKLARENQSEQSHGVFQKIKKFIESQGIVTQFTAKVADAITILGKLGY